MRRNSRNRPSAPTKRKTGVSGEFEGLRGLLRELFRLDGVDPVDSGTTRRQSEEIARLLDEDLLSELRQSPGPAGGSDASPLESEVVGHLCAFFRPYLDQDTFSPEPRCDGQEAKLVWADSDRYYVKCAERIDLPHHPLRSAARKALDCFIHKDLGGYLSRELDSYIKDEVMHLDDVEHETATEVGRRVGLIRVFRKAAREIIVHLERLENARKETWLRKKFVVGTNYCVSVDLVPEALYPEVAANVAQRDTWVKLLRIDEIRAGPDSPGYSEPLTVDFLKANPNLPLDTTYFTRPFVDRLLRSIDDLDAATTGLLVNADNFSALSLLQARYRRSAKCVYADPPYNTDGSPVVYKNGFTASSWLSMVRDRLALCRPLLRDDGILCATIDDCQHKELRYLLGQLFGEDRVAGTVVIRVNPSGRPIPSGFGVAHEYAIFAGRSKAAAVHKMPRTEAQLARYGECDERGRYMWELFRKRGSESKRRDRPTLYYPLYARGETVRVPKMHWDEAGRQWVTDEEPAGDERVLHPVDAKGVERRWRWKHEAVSRDLSQFRVRANRQGEIVVYYKYRPDAEGVIPTTVWTDAKYSATEHGTGMLKKLFSGYNVFDFPKSVFAVEDCLAVSGVSGDALCIDPFAGSGTTGHAVINLNRRDGGGRKFILIEMGAHFETVLKPRILKNLYSDSWDGGRPLSRKLAGSYLVKYLDLETFDDAMRNLDAVSLGGESFGPINADLPETFNWLLGLRVRHLNVIDGVRVVEGTNPEGERILVLWRDREEADSERLNEWFTRQGYASREPGFDLIYVNGKNDLASLRRGDQKWEVRLIESEFQKRMFDIQDV